MVLASSSALPLLPVSTKKARLTGEGAQASPDPPGPRASGPWGQGVNDRLKGLDDRLTGLDDRLTVVMMVVF